MYCFAVAMRVRALPSSSAISTILGHSSFRYCQDTYGFGRPCQNPYCLQRRGSANSSGVPPIGTIVCTTRFLNQRNFCVAMDLSLFIWIFCHSSSSRLKKNSGSSVGSSPEVTNALWILCNAAMPHLSFALTAFMYPVTSASLHSSGLPSASVFIFAVSYAAMASTMLFRGSAWMTDKTEGDGNGVTSEGAPMYFSGVGFHFNTARNMSPRRVFFGLRAFHFFAPFSRRRQRTVEGPSLSPVPVPLGVSPRNPPRLRCCWNARDELPKGPRGVRRNASTRETENTSTYERRFKKIV
mmetsp:Transcript_43736/g.86294  ORF Transcript_43736/g.86294 Transcript_43736/m.86294 type:complete len:296 (+) Transcript_43736:1499-2386(+)